MENSRQFFRSRHRRRCHACVRSIQHLAVIFLFFAFLPARAQSSTELKLPDSEGVSALSLDQLKVPTDEKKQPSKIELSFSEQRFPTEGQTQFQRQEYSNLGLDADLHARGKEIEAGAHGIYQGTMQSSTEQYFGIPELYVGETRSGGSGVRLTFGRQKRHWSRFDEEFGMGIWQPQLRWDYLNPIQQGLTGAFFDYQASRSTSVTFFMSPVFLPDQGPNFQLRDGQFQSQNRWFWAPRTNLILGQQHPPLGFELDNPRVSDVVFQPSIGGNVYFKSNSTPLWAQLSYAYKPMNQLHLGFDSSECMDVLNLSCIARIHPSVLMHRVVTGEMGIEDDEQRGWISVTSDVPTTPQGSPDWIQSSHSDVIFAGASYAHFLVLANHPGWIKLSYLKAFEQSQAEANSFVDERVESSLDRYPYTEIAAVEWDWTVLERAQSQLSWRTRYTYSITERGAWLSSQLWLEARKWSWNLGFDLLGSEIDPASPDAGLFTRYRENSRATGGVSYVF